MGATSKNSRDVDNNPHALKAKVDIRQRVLKAIGADTAAVFDAFAGSGQMHAAVWKLAKSYTGCDLKYNRGDRRLMFSADNRRVLRAIDLAAFNVFDLDSYGSPWETALILADRRRVAPGELVGVVITEGAGIAYKNNIVPHALQALTGVRQGVVGLSKKQDALLDRAVFGLAKRMNCTIEKRWQAAGKSGAAMRYVGIVLRGRGEVQVSEAA